MVTPEETVPGFSDDSRYAESVFYTQFNDVDFYVEDEEQENLYFLILRKLFPEVRFENIYPLRGKQNAIEHAKKNCSGRTSIYLLDKDFDDLLGKIHVQQNVFYLDKYCIENFLLEEKATMKFVISEKPRLKASVIAKKLGFSRLADEIILQLSKLFALFFVVQRHNIALKSTGHAPSFFCRPGDACNVNDEAVLGYAKSVKNMAAKQGLDINLERELQVSSDDFELTKPRGMEGVNVSGQFILHLLSQRLGHIFGLAAVPELHSFAYRLAQNCKFDGLGQLQRRVKSHLRS
jgi:hypothetical protein